MVQQFKDKVPIEKVISANKHNPLYGAINFVSGNFWITTRFSDGSNKKQDISLYECLSNYNEKRVCEVVVDKRHLLPKDFENAVIWKIQKINKDKINY